MKNKIVWIGKSQLDAINSNFKFYGLITRYGNSQEKMNYFVFDKMYRNIYSFIKEKILYFLTIDKNIKFYFYDQYDAYIILNHLNIKQNIICINSYELLKWLNNKSIVRQWMSNTIKIPKTIVLSKDEINYEKLKLSFPGFKKFIIQSMISSGGKGTYILDGKLPNLDEKLYIVSPYYQNNISINVTVLINKNKVIYFQPSIQVIHIKHKNCIYAGSDFIEYAKLPNYIKKAIIANAKKVVSKLQYINYIGICGMDFIIHNDEIYFLEINPRFQGSSFLIEKTLNEKYGISLYELNIQAFNNNISFNKNFEINYSFIYKNKLEKSYLNKLNNPIHYIDDINNYYRLIFNKNIINYKMEYTSNDYYDYFANIYHLMLKNWESKIDNQGKILLNIISKYIKFHSNLKILDCTCGIGIQAISLALENMNVYASDISINELEFAQKEAKKRNVKINFFYADCRFLEKYTQEKFDVIISIDSALPHLLNEENFLLSFNSIYNRLTKNGVFISSYRDYEKLLKSKPNMAYPVRFNKFLDTDYTILRKWKWDNDIILSTQYVIIDNNIDYTLMKSTYKQWAVTKDKLIEMAFKSNFSKVYWLLPEESGFTQPLLCAVK